jgi:MFS family permease
MALRQVVFQTTYLIGPALGGILIAVLPDIAWIYVIDAATFVAAMVALRWVPPQPPERVGTSVSLGMIKEGWGFVRRTPILLSIFVIDLVAMVFGMPRAVFPALAERTFDAGPAVVGLLYSAPGAGALVSALTTGWVGKVRHRGRAVIASVAVWGAAITLAGLAVFSLPLTLFLLALAGAADVVSAIFRGTMLLEATPDYLRGRVNAANIMVVSGGPRLGDFEAGVAASLVGAPGSIVLGGTLCLLGTAAVALLFPSLRSYLAPSEDRSD